MKAWILAFLVGAAVSATAATEDRPRVLLAELKAQVDQTHVIVPARVDAKVQSVQTAEVEGFVKRILKPLGSTVKAGDAILYVENTDPGYTYASVPMTAPIAGVVSQVWPTEMARVARGDKLFAVIDPTTLRVNAELAASDLALVRAGFKGSFSPENDRKKKIAVKIVGVSPLVDPRTGTATAEVEFIGKSVSPPMGTIGQLTFEVNLGKIILVPENALSYRDGKPMVRILKKDGTTTRLPVELGEQRDSAFVLKSGVSAGTKIVVRASRAIKEGELVEVEEAEGTKTP